MSNGYYRQAKVFEQAQRLVEKHEQRALEAAAQIPSEAMQRLLLYLVDTVLERNSPSEPTVVPITYSSPSARPCPLPPSSHRPRRPNVSDGIIPRSCIRGNLNVTEATPPASELDDLISLFYRATPTRDIQRTASRRLPGESIGQLLGHEDHMTVTVERRHGCQVDVQVLESKSTPTHYLRKIVLRRKSDRRVVQYGIVRLALDTLQPAVREEILEQKIPLGRVLIEHDVMRHVQLNALWEVKAGEELCHLFQVEPGHLTYGRTALIYCNGEPAVELLEIVAPEDSF